MQEKACPEKAEEVEEKVRAERLTKWGRSPTCPLRAFPWDPKFMSFYRRRLPHWQPEGVPIFLTWRLYGSVPRGGRNHNSLSTERERFLAMDREMDRASSGPTWLKDPRIASCFVDTLFLAEKKWELDELF